LQTLVSVEDLLQGVDRLLVSPAGIRAFDRHREATKSYKYLIINIILEIMKAYVWGVGAGGRFPDLGCGRVTLPCVENLGSKPFLSS
jgi:hypothetical protein